MVVRCKFRCVSIETAESWDKAKWPVVYKASFSPVTQGSEENAKFYAATPSGRIEIGAYTIAGCFEVGKEYYLDITPA